MYKLCWSKFYKNVIEYLSHLFESMFTVLTLFPKHLILDNELAVKNLYNNSAEDLWVFVKNVIIVLLDDVFVRSFVDL